MARVRFINNDGAGTADNINLREGETLGAFLQRHGVTNYSDYVIRVNGQEANLEEDVLQDGDRISAVSAAGRGGGVPLSDQDRISVTPKNVAGAFQKALKHFECHLYNEC